MRTSYGMPTARAIGPTRPIAIVSSRESLPTPFVRPIQTWFLVSSFSYSSSLPGNLSRNSLTACVEAARQILAQAADAQVAREHPEAGEHLVQVEQLLALAEAVHHHGDRADLHAVRAEPDEVAATAAAARRSARGSR